MKILLKISLQTRLSLAFAILLVLLLSTALLSVSMIRSIHSGLRSVYETKTVPMQQLEEINTIVLSSRISIMEMIDSPTSQGIKSTSALIREDLARVDELWTLYLTTPLDSGLKQATLEVSEARKAYVLEGLLPAIDALESGKVFDAKGINVQKISPLAKTLQLATSKLMKLQIESAGREYIEATSTLNRAYGTSAITTSVGILLGILLSSLVTKSVIVPLNEAISSSDMINRGDLSGTSRSNYNDEVGRLLNALSTMRESLSRLVRSVRSNAETVATTSRTLEHQSAEVARRTEDQAASLKELSEVVTELEFSVKQNANNASSAAQAARAASDTAQQGGRLMTHLVGNMKEITYSSNKIGEIVGRIESIAFQTNILSLNAAVEASRAGKTGSGFGAVAIEVRNLASSCDKAAKEIKSLISESLAKISNGANLVGKAGGTMNQIVLAIHDVSITMEKINTDSAEQSKSVVEFGDAIKRLESLGRKNSEIGKFSENAAKGLCSQAEDLVASVSVFTLEGTPTRF